MNQSRTWVNPHPLGQKPADTPQTSQQSLDNGISRKPLMPISDKFLEERTACLDIDLPADITKDQVKIAREYAIKFGQKIPSNVEQSAFYWYYMGSNWEEISNKLNIPIPMLIYSAFYYKWFERKKTVTSVRAGEKITRADAAAIDLITDAIVATAAIYKSQLNRAITDPESASSCPLIPKTFREMELLLRMMQSLQTKELPSGDSKQQQNSPVVNVNIANLGNGSSSHEQHTLKATVVENAEYEVLPSAQNESERIEILKLLQKTRI